MVMAVFFLQKKAMIFLLREVALQESSEKIDKRMDLMFGEPFAEEVGKLPSSGKLEKAGERLPIQFFVQAETDVLGVDTHDDGGSKRGRLPAGREDSPMNSSIARPIKFTEEYFLPGAEHQGLVGDKDGNGGAHEGCHDMGRRVSLKVFVCQMERGYFQKAGKNVILDGGIKPLINGQTGGGMGIEQTADTVSDIFPVDGLFHPRGDIDELHGGGSGDCYFPI